MNDILPITLQGKQRLEEELKKLMQVERPNVVKAIEEARSNGDLSENADYDAAKERQAWIEARIGEINAQLAGAQVVDTSKLSGDKVVFGAHVVLMDLDSEKEVNYQIVGVSEADVSKGKISIVSPLARALIGKVVGDEVVVTTPSGDKEYEISDLFFK
jgi:transcription elongation factor GreA